jgi:GDP-L-fucose synthase
MSSYNPTLVYHLAGAVFGVGGNLAFPGDVFRRNTLINTHVIDACRIIGAKKVVAMGTVAMYSDTVPIPLREDDVLEGRVHSSECYYAIAKRGMLFQLEAYKEQFGLRYALALSTNLYGPGDRFDEQHGHVVPSLIRKFAECAERGGRVSVWGDGSPTRDFLHTSDAARGLEILMQKGEGVFNLASGNSVSIRELVEILSDIFPDALYDWDVTKPMGQMVRSYDVSKLKHLGFSAQITLQQGLRETVDWYQANRGTLRLSQIHSGGMFVAKQG